MAASFEDKHGSYNCNGDPFVSPEEVKITSQPQAQDQEASEAMIPPSSRCPHLRLVPFSRVQHMGKGHEAESPQDCPQCGLEVADILCKELLVGCNNDLTNPLQFRDVMVLTHDQNLSDVSGIVQGLRDATLPVRVVTEDEAELLTHSFEGNEILAAWRGILRSRASRRVLVLLTPQKSDGKMMKDFKSVGAEHIIWVGPFHGEGDSDSWDIDVDDGVAWEDSPPSYNPLQNYDNNNISKGAKPVRRSSGSGPNDCCDQFCLNCYIDVGETGNMCCCPCCGEIGTACSNCCRAFGDCLSSFFCCCCDDSSGNGCGDCDCDCGDCDCNCGDCGDCDCGNCDCVIM